MQQYQLAQEKTLTNPIKMDADKHLLLSFKIKSVVNGRSMNAQQAFAKFTNLNTNKVVSFAAKLDSSNLYEIHLVFYYFSTIKIRMEKLCLLKTNMIGC